MLAIYFLTLGISAGLTGLFGQRLLESQGYLPSAFSTDLTLVGGIACAYLALQLLYMAFVQFLYPTRSSARLLAETASHLGSLVLLPYLAGVKVPWPHPALVKMEPLIYLGLFISIHGLFKLVSFYASIQGAPSGRLSVFGWLSVFCLAAGGAVAILDTWLKDMSSERPPVGEAVEGCRVGDEWASARVIPEGALLTTELAPRANPCLTYLWANPPELGPEEPPLDSVYVTVTVEGTTTERYATEVALRPDGWAECCVPAASIPGKPTRCSVTWTLQKEPAWRRITGLGPVAVSARSLRVVGPLLHETRQGPEAPNIVVVVIEALGADHVSGMGYERLTTPELDALAHGAATYSRAYTAAPEASAACMTLLTGLSPLRHGYLASHRGPLDATRKTLPEILRERHYATAAFTEGGSPEAPDLAFGSGFERGFDLFNDSCPDDSEATLDKAAMWINEHVDRKYMVFVRLRELRDPQMRAHYGKDFVKGANPTVVDAYDAGVRYIDQHLGAFIRELRDEKAAANTCVVVTSTYGLDFSSGPSVPPERLLSEACLRVPLFLFLTDGKRGASNDVISLTDLVPTLLEISRTSVEEPQDATAAVMPTLLDPIGTGLDYPLDGRTLITLQGTKEPVSMMGAPLVLSLRSEGWRFTWSSNQAPFAKRSRSEGQVVELYDVASAKRRGSNQDAAPRYPELVKHYRDYLNAYLDDRCENK